MMIRNIKSPSSLLFFFLSLALLSINLCGITSHATTTVIRCREAERQALLDLKQRLDDPSNRLSSWVGKDCCAWQGIGCSNITAHVTKLDLRNKDYDDFYYYYFGEWGKLALHGNMSIGSSLLSLKQLTHLDLSCNDFSGHNIPAFIGSFAKLTYLNLSRAGFTGKVPDQLGNLSTLRHLDLSDNHYSYGNFPKLYVENPSWIARLTSLRHLNMNMVIFRSTANWFQALNALPHIQDVEFAFCDLKGQLPHSAPHLNFTSLLTLNLEGNFINGTEPEWLYNITSLESVNFDTNTMHWSSMHGSITRLASLKELYLAGNIISQKFLLSLSNLCKLQILRLDQVLIKDEMPNLEMVFSGCLIYSLKELYLSGVLLNGSIPNSHGSLTSLQVLDLSYNNLNGTVGESIGQLKNLISLNLSHSSLSLSIIHLGNLSSLKSLDISYNTLFINETNDWMPPFQLDSLYMDSCKIVPWPHLPRWLKSQTTLASLYLRNASIQGTIPNWFPSSLQYLLLSDNSFTGEMPQNLTRLMDLDLANNMLSGHLSPTIGNTLLNLRYLDLSRNNFSGSIPHSLCQINLLIMLQVSKNNFSGELPDCWTSHSAATILDFSNNQFSGKIPDTLCNPWRIQFLQLSSNHLSGRIPLCLQDCKYLTILDAKRNYLVGNIPLWSNKSLSYLKVVNLRFNSLSGTIPDLSWLKCLLILDLSNNNLSGSIPQTFGNFTMMRNSPDYFNTFATFEYIFWLFIKGNEHEYRNSKTPVALIDLSNNNLSGYIPKELGNLDRLHSLNLSRNNLIGEIPRSINGMEYLEALDLSRNDLSGAIPSTLRDLKFLGILNLSYNNLSGSIPTGAQLNTFDASTYIGNPYLCGFPLMKNCTNDMAKCSVDEENKDDDRRETIWLLGISAMGFIIGFWGIWGILLFHKRWRTHYFHTIDDTYGKLCTKMLVKIRRRHFVED